MKLIKTYKQSILDATTKQELYEVAGYLNNYPEHINQDKVTFMAFFDLEEARQHCMKMLNEIKHMSIDDDGF